MADDEGTRCRAVLELSRVTRLKGRGDTTLPTGLTTENVAPVGVKANGDSFCYRAGTVGDACERSDGTNLSYRVRAKRIATIAAKIAMAA